MAAFPVAQLPVAAVVGGSHSDSGPGGLEERVHVLRGRPGEGKAETDIRPNRLLQGLFRLERGPHLCTHTRARGDHPRRRPGNRFRANTELSGFSAVFDSVFMELNVAVWIEGKKKKS